MVRLIGSHNDIKKCWDSSEIHFTCMDKFNDINGNKNNLKHIYILCVFNGKNIFVIEIFFNN